MSEIDETIDQILASLADPQGGLPQCLYGLSHVHCTLCYLLDDAEGQIPRRSAELLEVLPPALMAAIEEDPMVRQDETWGNTTALLDRLAVLHDRPWRDPAPDPRELLALVVATFKERESWEQCVEVLMSHPVLGDYNEAGELFSALEGDGSDEVRASMNALKKVFTPRKAVPENSWWTSQAPDWVRSWFLSNPT